MQSRSMAAARVADGAKCLAGKKDSGQRATGGREGPAGGLVAPSLGARPGLLTVRMQGTDFSVWSSSSFSGAAFSFLAARPLVAELGRAARLGDRAPVERGCSVIVALTSSPTSSPTFSARNPASSANCLIISCVSGNGVMRSRPLYSILIANRGRPSVSSPGLAPKMIFLFRLAWRFDFHH